MGVGPGLQVRGIDGEMGKGMNSCICLSLTDIDWGFWRNIPGQEGEILLGRRFYRIVCDFGIGFASVQMKTSARRCSRILGFRVYDWSEV